MSFVKYEEEILLFPKESGIFWFL